MRILVVEDEHKIASFIKKGLKAERYVVDVDSDGQSGLELALVYEYDLLRIRQVLINLLDNAIKYTPASGRVRVTIANPADHAIIEVTDMSQGIPAEALPHIFDRFFPVDKARSRELGGSGLGLAIARSTCELHGGRIEVESGIGRGARFRVETPILDCSWSLWRRGPIARSSPRMRRWPIPRRLRSSSGTSLSNERRR